MSNWSLIEADLLIRFFIVVLMVNCGWSIAWRFQCSEFAFAVEDSITVFISDTLCKPFEIYRHDIVIWKCQVQRSVYLHIANSSSTFGTENIDYISTFQLRIVFITSLTSSTTVILNEKGAKARINLKVLIQFITINEPSCTKNRMKPQFLLGTKH